jgi:hypothetical protein
VDHARDGVAIRHRLIPLAEVGVGADLKRAHLNLMRQLGLPGRINFFRERLAQLLELLVARPAEPGVLARCVQGRGTDRIEHIGRDK